MKIFGKKRWDSGAPVRFGLQDHLGSTVGLADSSGGVTDTNSYDSFGNPSNSSFPTRYQFTGREFDSFSGLQYSRARFYDPQIGRFISEDPIGFAGGDVNLYEYVWNNPVNFTDPSGLYPSMYFWPLHQKITSNALSDLASPEQIEALNIGTQAFDRQTQDPIYSPYHAMSRPDQTADDARAEANDYVRRQICLAREYEARGLDLSAMEALSRAIHAVQDATSPSHKGFQKAWPDTKTYTAIHIWHYINETFFPGTENKKAAEENTRRVWRYFKGDPMPPDFF